MINHRLQENEDGTVERVRVYTPDGLEGTVTRATFVFTCPSCGDPCAQTVEPSVDIHRGAGYTCDACGELVIFEAMTVAEYMTFTLPLGETTEE